MSIEPLSAEALRRRCDPASLPFQSTAELEELTGIVGQDRAVESIRFGARIGGEGYNVFAFGPGGTGKLTAARGILAREAEGRSVPDDWCYVHNFRQPHKPRALRLPAGLGMRLQQDLDRLLDDLLAAVPAAFQRDDFQARKSEIEEEFQERQHQALSELREEANRQHIVLIETPGGFAFAPMDEDGEAMSPAKYQQLPAEEQQRIKHAVEELQAKLQATIRQFPAWFKEVRERLRALSREIAEFAVGNLVEVLKERYAAHEGVIAYLDMVLTDIIDNVQQFLEPPHEQREEHAREARNHAFQRYRVNVLVDNGDADQAPVVYEDLPSHGNLLGRVEYRSQMGTLVTDFTLLKPGALHRANGGYLILEARQVLQQPFAWEALKRALRARELRIESPERTYGLFSTVSLEPEPIPLDVKIVLLGDRLLYYLLQAYDPDFADLFKVGADFEDRLELDEQATGLYARLFATIARREGLRALDRGAVAALLEQCCRLAEDSERVTADLRSINNLVHEADHWAGTAGRDMVTAEDVAQAIDRQTYRTARVRERLQDEIRRGTILIDTEGEAIGQVNGLSVVDLGDASFGQPSRITATTRLGDGEVLDIERETELGGAIHSKGVLILSNYLASRYAPGYPISMAGSLVFEQSYGMVEGDSASLGELCALLSSLAVVGVRQGLAVTGSVNQLGEVQAIGGVNHKIEGFFDVCRMRGAAEPRGVLIPASNTPHLMLRPDVVEAAREGRFRVYPVATVDEAIELLTGMPAGARDAHGRFPDGTVNARVEARLLEFSRQRQAFSRDGGEG